MDLAISSMPIASARAKKFALTARETTTLRRFVCRWKPAPFPSFAMTPSCLKPCKTGIPSLGYYIYLVPKLPFSFDRPTAKISRMPVREAVDERKDPACPRYLSSQLVLPSGKVIDSSGIPASLGKEELERILKMVDSQTNGKGYLSAILLWIYSSSLELFPSFRSSASNNPKSLYVAAKNGDIERVVECLSTRSNRIYKKKSSHKLKFSFLKGWASTLTRCIMILAARPLCTQRLPVDTWLSFILFSSAVQL